MRPIRLHVFGCCLCGLIGAAWGTSPARGQPQIELRDESLTAELALGYFREAKALSERDGGELWGLELYGAMMFVDPQSRHIIANQGDREGHLTPQDDVFVGTLPKDVMIAGTAVEWAGRNWTMLPWPLPRDASERRHFMAHEMWHRVQGQLGLPGAMPPNTHLDTREGRIWLRLEWRALRAALQADGDDRRKAISDVLLFRAYRRSLFDRARAQESRMEMHEGLAEYTGVRLSDEDETAVIRRAIDNLQQAEGWSTFPFSFAYPSGPAYGLLLDAAAPGWRQRLSSEGDLGGMLQAALAVSLAEDLKPAAAARAKAYDGEALIAAENEREDARQRRLSEYRARFVNGPRLILPLTSPNIGFNPQQLVPLDDLGTVYPSLKASDVWGVLRADGGALLYGDWSRIVVPAPDDPAARPLQGDGWMLDLKDGWKVVPAERAGDYTLKK